MSVCNHVKTMKESKQTLQNFLGYTSLHGLGRIGDASFWYHKLFWVVLFLGSFGFCIYQISRLANTYIEYPITTKMTISQGPLMFPAVTICNLNLVNYENVLEDPNLFQIIEELSKLETLGVNLSEFSTTPVPRFKYTEPLMLLNEDDPDDAKAIMDGMRLFSVRVANLTDEKMSRVTYETAFFVISCSYMGTKCTEANFTRYRDDTYGLCHLFNITDYLVYMPGSEAGLEVLISVRQDMYTPFMTKSSGVRVALHHPTDKPDMVNEGFSLATGFETDLKIAAVERTRVAGPKVRCDDSNQWRNLHACIKNCTSHEAAAACGCTTSRSVLSLRIPNLCLSLHDIECHKNEEARIMSSLQCKDCKVPCSEKIYTNSYSVTKLPAKRYEPILKSTLFDMFDETADFNAFRDDVLLFRVYYPSLTTEAIIEERSYTDENFVSDIGGQLGLWIGMSVLSLTEVFELMVLLVVACCRRNRKTTDVDSDSA